MPMACAPISGVNGPTETQAVHISIARVCAVWRHLKDLYQKNSTSCKDALPHRRRVVFYQMLDTMAWTAVLELE
jgi:hypothetical protein